MSQKQKTSKKKNKKEKIVISHANVLLDTLVDTYMRNRYFTLWKDTLKNTLKIIFPIEQCDTCQKNGYNEQCLVTIPKDMSTPTLYVSYREQDVFSLPRSLTPELKTFLEAEHAGQLIHKTERHEYISYRILKEKRKELESKVRSNYGILFCTEGMLVPEAKSVPDMVREYWKTAGALKELEQDLQSLEKKVSESFPDIRTTIFVYKDVSIFNVIRTGGTECVKTEELIDHFGPEIIQRFGILTQRRSLYIETEEEREKRVQILTEKQEQQTGDILDAGDLEFTL